MGDGAGAGGAGRRPAITAGILAHVDAGKTTLSEAILLEGGVIKKAGRVDDGGAFLDHYAMERERGITIFSKQAVIRFPEATVNLLDTPGHVDFSPEMERALWVLDCAILVISAPDGVQSHARTLWRLLSRYGVPAFIFVNKMDQPGADKEALMGSLRAQLGDGIVDFSGAGGEEFLEEVALCDEAVMERYLKEGEIGDGEITGLIAERKLFPCFFGSALRGTGVGEFLSAFLRYAPARKYPGEFGARAFKVARDAQGARLTYLKVTGGSLRVRQQVGGEKVSQIRVYSGERYEAVEEALPGDVCAVVGLSGTRPGEGLGYEAGSRAPLLEPVLRYQVIPPEGTPQAVLLGHLRELEEEEPMLSVSCGEGGEAMVSLMGEIQVEILGRLMMDRFGMEVGFGPGKVGYRETILGPAEGVGHFEPLRHYAEVHLLLEPGEPGSGIVASSALGTDELDVAWQRHVLSFLRDNEHPGVLSGAPVTDIQVTLIAGRAHEKHTEGGDFRQAAGRALRQGLMQAECALLEPYYDFILEVPGESLGRAIADVERMQGTVQIDQGEGDLSGLRVIRGHAPVAKMQNYQRELSSYTKGLGRLSVSLRGYFPCQDADDVIAAAAYDPEADADHPCSSVFCAHGAGFSVPWDQVFDYMHLPLAWGGGGGGDAESGGEDFAPRRVAPRGSGDAAASGIGQEEVEEILSRAGLANRREKGSPRRNAWGGKGGSAAAGAASQKGAGGASTRTYGGSEKKKGPEYLLVDGYNVIFAWGELSALAKESVGAARGRLLDILCNYQGFRGCEVIVVFDAYRVEGHRAEALDYHNIHVVYTGEAETADQYIEKFAHEHAARHDVTVATSDGLEQVIIRGAGCALLSARDFEQEVRRVCGEGAAYAAGAKGGKRYLLDGIDVGGIGGMGEGDGSEGNVGSDGSEGNGGSDGMGEGDAIGGEISDETESK